MILEKCCDKIYIREGEAMNKLELLKTLKLGNINQYLEDLHLKESIEIKELCMINLPTGIIAANDPLVLYKMDSYNKTLQSGEFPVFQYIHHINSSNKTAFLEIRFNNNIPVSFEEAISNNNVNSYEIESGVAGFMDSSVEEKLMSLNDEQAESVWNELNHMYEDKGFINYFLEETNIVGITSGYGEGTYKSYFGLDKNNDICCLITDFETIVINADYESQPHYFWGITIDEGEWHYCKIYDEELPLDKLAGYNHLAVYLRWCIEHHLMSQSVLKYFSSLPALVYQKKVDLREVLDKSPIFNGQLCSQHFNDLGREFTESFYLFNKHSTDFYPTCVDDYTEKVMGTERYNCKEYKDEAYLFMEYDEEYYQGLSKYIDKKWQEFLKSKYQ